MTDQQIVAYNHMFHREEFLQGGECVDRLLDHLEQRFVLDVHAKGLGLATKPTWNFWVEPWSWTGMRTEYVPVGQLTARAVPLSDQAAA